MNILSLYFSGTGNTKWVSSNFTEKMNTKGNNVLNKSIEEITVDEVSEIISDYEYLLISYPAYGNYMPLFLEDYLKRLASKGKMNNIKGISIDVQGMYAADGVLAVKWFFDEVAVEHIGGYNVYMSCNFNTLIPGFRIASDKKQFKQLDKAYLKIEKIIKNLENGVVKLEKTDIVNKLLGKLEEGPNKKMMVEYDVKINKDLCIGCKKCIKVCPLDNFELDESGKKVKTKGDCTICLRCVNQCPTYAIRFFSEKGSKPYKQYKGPIDKRFK